MPLEVAPDRLIGELRAADSSLEPRKIARIFDGRSLGAVSSPEWTCCPRSPQPLGRFLSLCIAVDPIMRHGCPSFVCALVPPPVQRYVQRVHRINSLKATRTAHARGFSTRESWPECESAAGRQVHPHRGGWEQ